MDEKLKSLNMKVYVAMLLLEEAYKQHAEVLKKYPARNEHDAKLYSAYTDLLDFFEFEGFSESHDPETVLYEVLGIIS